MMEDSIYNVNRHTDAKKDESQRTIGDILNLNLPLGRNDPTQQPYFRDYFHKLAKDEKDQAEQKIKDFIRGATKIVLTCERWETREEYKPSTTTRYTVDITKSGIVPEISDLFFFEEEPVIPPDSLIMDNPNASLVFYPSGIQFDFYLYGPIEESDIRIRSDQYKYMRLEGNINKEFVEKCLTYPVHDNHSVWDMTKPVP